MPQETFAPPAAPAAANPIPLADLCANVRSSFDRLAIFAQQHDLSFSLAAFYVLVGSLNILPLEGGRLIFEPISPARLARVARMEPKTVSRWCTELSKRGLLNRARGAYSIERLADWYLLAGCMQTVPLPPLPGLTEATVGPMTRAEAPHEGSGMISA